MQSEDKKKKYDELQIEQYPHIKRDKNVLSGDELEGISGGKIDPNKKVERRKER